MGFLLYRTESMPTGLRHTKISTVSLAGAKGLLASWLLKQADEDLPFQWELSGPSLIEALLPNLDPENHCLVLDMEPERLVGATLCKVQRLAGSSDADESDVVLVMNQLLKIEGGSSKNDFIAPVGQPGEQVLESIGVSGGTKGGRFRWCKPKMNIGAAVCQPKTPKPTADAGPSTPSLAIH